MIPHKTTHRSARAHFPVRAHAWPTLGETAIAFFPPLPALRGSRAELSVTACPRATCSVPLTAWAGSAE